MFYLNIQSMYYIKTIAEVGNLSKAAEKLYTTQPNLTRTIKGEEQRIGLPIFNKETNPWSLTFTGQLYIEIAKEMLALNAKFSMQTKNIINEQKGLLKIGLMAFEERYLMPKLLPIIKKDQLDWYIETIIVTSLEVTSLLYKNIVDFAMVVTEDDPDLEHIPIKTYDIILALPIDHPLAHNYKPLREGGGFPTLDLKLLENDPFIILAGTKLTQYIDSAVLKNFGFRLNKAFTVYSTDAAIANVEAGLGATFVLDSVAKDRYKLNRTAFFRIKGMKFQQQISLAYLKHKRLNSLEKTFIEKLKKMKL